jgi:hypothetical protein
MNVHCLYNDLPGCLGIKKIEYFTIFILSRLQGYKKAGLIPPKQAFYLCVLSIQEPHALSYPVNIATEPDYLSTKILNFSSSRRKSAKSGK